MGDRSMRQFLFSVKSLVYRHFKPNASANPIHLHTLIDKPAQLSLIVILETWRINKLTYTFYRAETYQVSSSLAKNSTVIQNM